MTSDKKNIVRPEFLEKFGNKKTEVRMAFLEQLRFDFRKLEEKLTKLEEQKKPIEINQEEIQTTSNLHEEIHEDLHKEHKDPIESIKIEPEKKIIEFEEFPNEEIYQQVHLTPFEGLIVKSLASEPMDYRQLSLATNITIDQLRTHKKDLTKKGIPIMIQKVSGFPQRMFIKPETLKRFQLTVSNKSS